MTTPKKKQNFPESTPFQVRSKSLQTGSESLFNGLHPDPIKTRTFNAPLTYSDPTSCLSGMAGAIYLIQSRTGARIKEVLNLRTENIISINEIYIKGMKRSHDKIAVVPELRKHLRLFINAQGGILFPVSYHKIYRIYKQHGIIQKFGKNKINSVTHKVRYDFINRVNNFNNNQSETRHIVGHKSQSSTNGYLRRSLKNG